jgi:hypothetical protein
MKKSVKLACQVVNSSIAIGSLPTLQISLRIVTFFEKIYDGKPILTVFSNIGDNVQYRCFKQVYNVKSASQPDTMPILENNYCLQMIETGFAEHDGACTNLFENFSQHSLKRDLSNDTTVNPPLFSLVNTFKVSLFHCFKDVQGRIV